MLLIVDDDPTFGEGASCTGRRAGCFVRAKRGTRERANADGGSCVLPQQPGGSRPTLRQRQTLRVLVRTPLSGLSIRFVVARHLGRLAGMSRRCNVNISWPSRKL